MGKALIITTGGGTDTTDGNPNPDVRYILSGYTVYNLEGELITGTLETKTLVKTLNPGGNTTIPAGYYAGDETSVVTGVALADKTSATAVAGNVLDSKTGWSKGKKITGSMVNKGKIATYYMEANATYAVPAGWHNGEGLVRQSLGNVKAISVTPTTYKQTVVDAESWVSEKQTVVGDKNLKAENIKKNVTIFGVKGTYYINTKDVKNGVWLVKDGVPQLDWNVTYSKDVGDWITNQTYWKSYVEDVQHAVPATTNDGFRFRVLHMQDNSVKDNDFDHWYVYAGWTLDFGTSIRVNPDTGVHQLSITLNKIAVQHHKSQVIPWYIKYVISVWQDLRDQDDNQICIAANYAQYSGGHYVKTYLRPQDTMSDTAYPVTHTVSYGLNTAKSPGYKHKLADNRIHFSWAAELVKVRFQSTTMRYTTSGSDRQLLEQTTTDFYVKDVLLKKIS